MRRRTRIDLGQGATSYKDEERINRKRQKWAELNKDKPPEENPFLMAIHPNQEQFGDVDEKVEDLKERLKNLEFGNFPGYFKYRTKAAAENKSASATKTDVDEVNDKNFSITTTQFKEKPDREGTVIRETDLSEETSTIDDGLSDQRLRYFKREWFEGKDILDIGCNRGHIVYAIGRFFNPNLVVGIDIDSKMIQMANRDLHLHLEKAVISEASELRRQRAAELKLTNPSSGDGTYIEHTDHYPLSSYITQGPIALATCMTNQKEQQQDDLVEKKSPEGSSGNEMKEDEKSLDYNRVSRLNRFGNKFPNNIVFLEHNYVLSRDELVDKQKEQFDVIVCLSVTKWIHLNYRDSGLKRFFKRAYRHLKEGGLFILEAQPFDNYGRRKKLSDRLKSNFYSIQFKPDQFDQYLLGEEVGFKRIIHETMTEHECAGFKRPMRVFLK